MEKYITMGIHWRMNNNCWMYRRQKVRHVDEGNKKQISKLIPKQARRLTATNKDCIFNHQDTKI